MKYEYDYPMFSVATDILVYDENANILFIRRKNEPHKNKLSLPGGFVNTNEKVITAAARELFEETNLYAEESELYPNALLDDVDRDPRGRVISHVFDLIVDDLHSLNLEAKDDAAEIVIINAKEVKIEDLAFDHALIVKPFVDFIIYSDEANDGQNPIL